MVGVSVRSKNILLEKNIYLIYLFLYKMWFFIYIDNVLIIIGWIKK